VERASSKNARAQSLEVPGRRADEIRPVFVGCERASFEGEACAALRRNRRKASRPTGNFDARHAREALEDTIDCAHSCGIIRLIDELNVEGEKVRRIESRAAAGERD